MASKGMPPDAAAAFLRQEAKQILRGCPTGLTAMTRREALAIRAIPLEALEEMCRQEAEKETKKC